jgi:integrase
MFKEIGVSREKITEKEWLEGIFEKSNSINSKLTAQAGLKAFAIFCKAKLEIPNPDILELEIQYKEKRETVSTVAEKEKLDSEWLATERNEFAKVYSMARDQIIAQYKEWYDQERPDIQSICTSLQKFVRFCSNDQDEVLARNISWKAKKPQSIKNYFAHIKDFLRTCHGIRITTDDVKDYIKFPTKEKQARQPLELDTIKKILAHSSPRRRALYYLLLTSGMRLGEALSLKKHNFKIDVRPIQVHIRAQDAKTGQARDTFVSEEAWERIAPIYEATKEGKFVFHDSDLIFNAVRIEDKYFHRLRERIAEQFGDREACDEFPDGTGILKKYENSVRYCVQIHAMRAYFMTVASLRHGTDYSHGLAGHSTYLDQYIRIAPKLKSKMYLELEKDLLLETSKIHSEQFHELEFAEMVEKVAKMQIQLDKTKLPSSRPDEWTGVTQ